MRIYYLDTPLEDGELEQLRVALCGAGAADPLQQVRIPCVLPTVEGPADVHGTRAQRLHRLAIRHLRCAGLDQDLGHQVGWVSPRDAGWGEIFEAAIQHVTGYHPIAVQRWRTDVDGMLERAPLCVMDMHGMRHAAASGHRVP